MTHGATSRNLTAGPADVNTATLFLAPGEPAALHTSESGTAQIRVLGY